MSTHDEILREKCGVTLRTVVRRITAAFDRASASDVESGARWYDAAGELASSLATEQTPREHVAAVIAALSPRTSWARNVAGATALITSGPKSARATGCIGANVERAALAKRHGPDALNGPKTQRFCANIIGDREAVTVDVWAARVAGISERELTLTGVYDAIEHAYRLAAARRGVDPATMQATTWVVARNGRAG